MNNRSAFWSAVLMLLCTASFAAEPRTILALPNPQTDGGRPLMQVLKHRNTSRAFSPEKLSAQVLSNLLWAAFGVNRPDGGRRTAPSAMNWQEIDIYVATADGLFLFDAKHATAGNRVDDFLLCRKSVPGGGHRVRILLFPQ